MSNLQSSASKAQMIELLNSIKIPIMGAGGGFAPIGTINFFDASVAPLGWLACDGSTHNISDYPELATFYASVHGASNFYGGDGTTTFAVPDLRGEFLRGTGTNSHTNQGSGANVGVHQDGTEIPFMSIRGTTTAMIWSESTMLETTKEDSKLKQGTTVKNVKLTGVDGETGASTNAITTRPTNTSFLICVKATVAGDPNAHVYSTEEQVIGTWIDGSYEYEKVFVLPSEVSISNSSWTSVGIPSNGFSIITFSYGCSKLDGASIKTMGGSLIPCIRNNELQFIASRDGEVLGVKYIILRYTKTQ